MQEENIPKKEEKDIVVPIPDIPVEVVKIKKIKIQDIGANLNVRVSPDKSAGIASQVKSGAIYAVAEEKPDWFKIEYEEDGEGWISNQYAKKVEGSSKATPTPTRRVSPTPTPKITTKPTPTP